MKIHSTYSVKIKEYRHIFKGTITIYRNAVDYLISVCLNEWNNISVINGDKAKQRYVEMLTHTTKDNLNSKYNFDAKFYKMPCYYRRACITEAIGKVSSYMSNLANWKTIDSAFFKRWFFRIYI